MATSGLRLLEWRVWRQPEGFSRNQRASWYGAGEPRWRERDAGRVRAIEV